MRLASLFAGALGVCVMSVGARSASAQSPVQVPCSITPAVVDSARDDAFSILNSGRPIVLELRKEQGITAAADLQPVTVIRERFICARIAGTFAHIVPPGVTFVVLKIGPLYYARDPDQRRGTGVFTDSTFHVVMRLGTAIETKSPQH
jgi:hypothetical protein